MKKIIVLISAAILLFACNNKKPVSQEDLFGKEVASEKGTVFENSRVKNLNQSSIHFNEAIASFENGKMDEVALHLEEGTNALVNEGKFLKGEPRKRLENAVKALEAVRAKLKKGELKDITEVHQVVSAAQLTLAQEYVVDLDEYTVTVPLPDSYYPHFKTAMKAIQGAEPHLTGAARQAAIKLVKESESLMDKIDAGDQINEEIIKDQHKQMEMFLKDHHLKQ